jgi:hypothetical protein
MWQTLPEIIQQHFFLSSCVVLLIVAIVTLVLKSIYSIGPTEVGLVRKRFGAPLPEDNPIAFHGEAERVCNGRALKAAASLPESRLLYSQLRRTIGQNPLGKLRQKAR